MYATYNIHSGHIQGPSAHTYTSVHTLIPRTEQFVHTGGVDTCIYYMYLLAFRSLPVPSVVAMGLHTRGTPQYCIIPADGAAIYLVGWHEARSSVLSSRLLLSASALRWHARPRLMRRSWAHWRPSGGGGGSPDSWECMPLGPGHRSCASFRGQRIHLAASGSSLGERSCEGAAGIAAGIA